MTFSPDPDGYEVITTQQGDVRHLRHLAWGMRTACGRVVAPHQVACRDTPGSVTAGCRTCARSFRGRMAQATLAPLGRDPFPAETE